MLYSFYLTKNEWIVRQKYNHLLSSSSCNHLQNCKGWDLVELLINCIAHFQFIQQNVTDHLTRTKSRHKNYSSLSFIQQLYKVKRVLNAIKFRVLHVEWVCHAVCNLSYFSLKGSRCNALQKYVNRSHKLQWSYPSKT